MSHDTVKRLLNDYKALTLFFTNITDSQNKLSSFQPKEANWNKFNKSSHLKAETTNSEFCFKWLKSFWWWWWRYGAMLHLLPCWLMESLKQPLMTGNTNTHHSQSAGSPRSALWASSSLLLLMFPVFTLKRQSAAVKSMNSWWSWQVS